MSIMDGWWEEGYNGNNGWAFGQKSQQDSRDQADARALYEILEKEIIPLYYKSTIDGIPYGWVKIMNESMKSVCNKT